MFFRCLRNSMYSSDNFSLLSDRSSDHSWTILYFSLRDGILFHWIHLRMCSRPAGSLLPLSYCHRMYTGNLCSSRYPGWISYSPGYGPVKTWNLLLPCTYTDHNVLCNAYNVVYRSGSQIQSRHFSAWTVPVRLRCLRFSPCSFPDP